MSLVSLVGMIIGCDGGTRYSRSIAVMVQSHQKIPISGAELTCFPLDQNTRIWDGTRRPFILLSQEKPARSVTDAAGMAILLIPYVTPGDRWADKQERELARNTDIITGTKFVFEVWLPNYAAAGEKLILPMVIGESVTGDAVTLSVIDDGKAK